MQPSHCVGVMTHIKHTNHLINMTQYHMILLNFTILNLNLAGIKYYTLIKRIIMVRIGVQMNLGNINYKIVPVQACGHIDIF